ncbi:ABC transporter permease [Tumebacillus flagellatus]|uniref:ABC transporter permease n=1 Tax=Tumebacillus flagellatus TaxID=1157490 RepID=A0A074LRK2_9BACL|nr:ABC transporter permease [Tumebacillus flagellatus]KEO82463.1 hypothetical protein EL26_15405 [Tumebacillus flagellatus]
MFWNSLVSEWMKVRKSSLWFLIPVGPLLGLLLGWLNVHTGETHPDAQGQAEVHDWLWMYPQMLGTYAVLFLPLVAGVYASLLCRFEHLNGGWKQLLALPVSRSTLYLTKLVYLLGMLALTQFLWLAGVLIFGLCLQVEGSIPWTELGKSGFSGWLTLVPLAALQLWVATVWKNFGLPFALNVILAIPGMLLLNAEKYRVYYLWSQPYLGMSPTHGGILNLAPISFWLVLGGSLVLVAAGWTHFVKRDVQH